MSISLEHALRPQRGDKLRLNGFEYEHGQMLGIVSAPNDRVEHGQLRYRNEVGVVSYDREYDEISIRLVDWLALSALGITVDRAIRSAICGAFQTVLFGEARSDLRLCIIVDRELQQVAA